MIVLIALLFAAVVAFLIVSLIIMAYPDTPGTPSERPSERESVFDRDLRRYRDMRMMPPISSDRDPWDEPIMRDHFGEPVRHMDRASILSGTLYYPHVNYRESIHEFSMSTYVRFRREGIWYYTPCLQVIPLRRGTRYPDGRDLIDGLNRLHVDAHKIQVMFRIPSGGRLTVDRDPLQISESERTRRLEANERNPVLLGPRMGRDTSPVRANFI